MIYLRHVVRCRPDALKELLKAFIDASSVRIGLAQRHKGMNSKLNHIKPAFAPETEFQVETLAILPEDQTAGEPVPTGRLDLSKESEFFSWPGNSFSAFND